MPSFLAASLQQEVLITIPTFALERGTSNVQSHQYLAFSLSTYLAVVIYILFSSVLLLDKLLSVSLG